MSDEEVTLENEDSAVTQDASTEDVDWQKRYTDTQAEYTRSQQALKEQQSVWEDEQALLARIGEKYPHLIAEDDAEDDEDLTEETPAPQQDPRVDLLMQEMANQRWERDLGKVTGDRELTDFGRNILEQARQAGAIKNEDDLTKAVTDWFTYEDSLRPPEETTRKKAPHVLPGGQANTGAKPFHEMTRKERLAHQLERAQGLESQA